MNNNHLKLAKKIISGIKIQGFIDKLDIDKFIDLNRSEAKEVIEHLIELEEDEAIKFRLRLLLERNPYMYDPRLTLLMIWISFDTTIQKSFDSENII